jgi:hypothetical protein
MPAEPTQTCHHGNSRRVRPEEALARLGLRQHRQVTTTQIHEAGWSARVISARVNQGRLHPTFSEVFSLGGPARTDREFWMAATLTFGPHTKLAATSAAELYGWLRFPTKQLHVITTTERRPREGITPHHRTKSVAWRHIDHIPVTGPEQTILDCATTIPSDKAYRRIVRQAQVDELTSHAHLLAFAALNHGARGVARLKRELADGPSPTRSAFEDDVLDLFRHGGQPIPNYKLGHDEFDLAWPALRKLLEVQGSPHDNPTAHADDIAKEARAAARGFEVYWLS